MRTKLYIYCHSKIGQTAQACTSQMQRPESFMGFHINCGIYRDNVCLQKAANGVSICVDKQSSHKFTTAGVDCWCGSLSQSKKPHLLAQAPNLTLYDQTPLRHAAYNNGGHHMSSRRRRECSYHASQSTHSCQVRLKAADPRSSFLGKCFCTASR